MSPRHRDVIPALRAPTAVRRLPLAVRRFLETETSGGVLLLVAAFTALAWANSPWTEGYEQFRQTEVALRVGSIGIQEDLQHFVNDALMALFFLVVGLELKREMVTGDLRDRHVVALSVFAALGGMVVPAAIYAAVNAGGPGSGGWGIPMATDTAFTLGVLALLGKRVPSNLKLFVLSFVIVDDIGAFVAIAFFYADELDPVALALAGTAAVASMVLYRAGVSWVPVHVALGVACWLGTYNSGVHAAIAGVVIGLLTPAQPLAAGAVARRWTEDLADDPTAADLTHLTSIATSGSVSRVERLLQVLHPITSHVVVPIFALANAGVRVHGGVFNAPGAGAVALGVAAGLVVGKTIGVAGGTWLAVRLQLTLLPPDVAWRHVTGAGALAGMGFTMSLLITDLAFADPALRDAAKVAVLFSCVATSVPGALILRSARPGGGGG